MLDTLETTFQGKKTFCLVKGSLSWWEMPDFHKGEGGGATVFSFLTKQLYLRNQASDTPLLILAHFLALYPGDLEKSKLIWGAYFPPHGS